MPKISIITVCKNPGSDFKRTLQSIVSQVYSDYEYIVIDGNSSDGTHDLLGEFDYIIDKLIIESDKGLYDAMNKGILNATGDYCIFLNAGDKFTTEYSVLAVVTTIEQNKAEIYYGKIIWVDITNNYVVSSKHEHIKYKSQLQFENFPHPATIYSKNCFKKYGLYDTSYPIYADYEWNLRALLKYNASFYLINSIITTFYTGGLSTNDQYLDKKQKEKQVLRDKFFKDFSSYKLKNMNALTRRFLFKKKNNDLNRVY